MRLRALLLLAVLVLAGCQDPEPSASGSDPEARLAQLPGIRDAEIGDDDAADDPSQQYVVVDAEPDATADQVADALRAVAELEPSRSVLYLGAGNTDLSQPLDAQVSVVNGTDDPDTSAAQLVAGAALDGVRVTIDGGAIRVALSIDGGDAAAVGAVADEVLADEVLAEAAPLSVTATAVSPGRASAVAVLSSDQPLTGDLVLAWTRLSDAGAALDGGVTLGRTTLSGGSAVRVDALLGLDGADPAGLTPDGHPELAPLVEAALDVVRAAPAGAVVRFALATPDGLGDPFLELTTGADGPVVTPDPQGRGWGDLATAYLAG